MAQVVAETEVQRLHALLPATSARALRTGTGAWLLLFLLWAAPTFAQITIGNLPTLGISVNFDGSQPWVPDEHLRSAIQGTNNDVTNWSRGQTWITTTITPWVTIADPGCDMTTLQVRANAAVQALGYNPNAYYYRVYAFPHSPCGNGIAGTANPGNVFIHGSQLWATTHEFGHALGLLMHAQTIWIDYGGCSLLNIAPLPSCQVSDYNHPWDVMGNGSGGFNVPEQERLGWLVPYRDPKLTTISASGTYRIENLTGPLFGTGPAGLRISRRYVGLTPALVARESVYFEHRPDVYWGIIATASDGRYHALIDKNPGPPFNDATFNVGERYVDPAGNFTVHVDAADETGASISVTMHDPPLECSPATQTVPTNTPATVTTTGGNGTTWWINSQLEQFLLVNAQGPSYTTTLPVGTHTVTASSGPQSASCQVVVTTTVTVPRPAGKGWVI